jgi:hypothetical protein
MQSTDPTPPLTTSNSSTTSSTSTPGPPTPNVAKGKCTKDHVRYCMDVLAAHFEGREPMRPGFSGANDKSYVPIIPLFSISPNHIISDRAEVQRDIRYLEYYPTWTRFRTEIEGMYWYFHPNAPSGGFKRVCSDQVCRLESLINVFIDQTIPSSLTTSS